MRVSYSTLLYSCSTLEDQIVNEQLLNITQIHHIEVCIRPRQVWVGAVLTQEMEGTNIADVPIPSNIAKGGAMATENAKDIRFEAPIHNVIFTRLLHAHIPAIKEILEKLEI